MTIRSTTNIVVHCCHGHSRRGNYTFSFRQRNYCCMQHILWWRYIKTTHYISISLRLLGLSCSIKSPYHDATICRYVITIQYHQPRPGSFRYACPVTPLPSLALTSFYHTIKQSLGPYLVNYTYHNLASALYLALGRIKPKDLFYGASNTSSGKNTFDFRRM